jgi:hypothetical protein
MTHNFITKQPTYNECNYIGVTYHRAITAVSCAQVNSWSQIWKQSWRWNSCDSGWQRETSTTSKRYHTMLAPRYNKCHSCSGYYVERWWGSNTIKSELFLYLFMAQQHPSGPSRSHYRRFVITDTTQSIGLIWPSDQPDSKTSTWQHTTHMRHPCSRWDSIPQSQQASGRRPTPFPRVIKFFKWNMKPSNHSC